MTHLRSLITLLLAVMMGTQCNECEQPTVKANPCTQAEFKAWLQSECVHVAQLEGVISELQRAKERMELQKKALTDVVNRTRYDLDKLSRENERLQRTIDKRENDIVACNDSCNHCNASYADAVQQLNLASGAYAKLIQNIEKEEAVIREIETQRRRLAETLVELIATLGSIQTDSGALRARISSVIQSLRALQETLEERRAELSDLDDELRNATDQWKQIMATAERLRQPRTIGERIFDNIAGVSSFLVPPVGIIAYGLEWLKESLFN